MLTLPDELLDQIARQVVGKEGGLRLWCQLSSTCRRLRDFQLPSEPAYLLDNVTDDGKLWALRRLRQARKLNLSLCGWQAGVWHYYRCDWAEGTTQASRELTKLDTLALNRFGRNGLLSLYEPCIRTLLLCARSLAALSTHLAALPRSIALHSLPLRHLEIYLSSRETHEVAPFFRDISRSCTLESLTMVFDPLNEVEGVLDSLQLPDVHLRGMPSLKHFRLDNCFPVRELSLPDDCSLFLDAICGEDIKWHEHCTKLQRHTMVLRLRTSQFLDGHGGLQPFSKLQYLELDMEGDVVQEIAKLEHIPHVKVTGDCEYKMMLMGGSWESLEIFQFGELEVIFSSVDTFVRGTRGFTFMAESRHGYTIALMEEIQRACLWQGKACHVVQHKDKQCGKRGTPKGWLVDYVILSTSKEMAENFPFVDNNDYGPLASLEMGKTLADREHFWPSDPCASVKRA